MELGDLKLVSASNIISLRTSAGLTQAELGAKLNYSDKTISKWERGEAIPDAFVLTQMAELFGVTVDYILSSHDAWEPPLEDTDEPDQKYSVDIIIAIAIIGVMTIALTAFVTLWLMDIIEWRVFLIGGSVALLTYMVLDCVFHKGRKLQYILSLFILSLFVLAYFFVRLERPWQLFLIAIPAITIVFLACNIRKKPKNSGNKKQKQ